MTKTKLYCNDISKSFYSHKTPEATKVGVMNYVMGSDFQRKISITLFGSINISIYKYIILS